MNSAKSFAELAPADIQLQRFLESQNYYNVRFLEDGVVCNAHYIFTTAVIINPNYGGFERRICYPKGSGLAERMLTDMQSVDDPPLPGYTALK